MIWLIEPGPERAVAAVVLWAVATGSLIVGRLAGRAIARRLGL